MTTSESESDDSKNEDRYEEKSKRKRSRASSMASSFEEADVLSLEDEIVEISSAPADDEIIEPFEGLEINALGASEKDEVGFAMRRVGKADPCS